MSTDISAIIEQVQSYTDDTKSLADDALKRLEDIASLPFQTWVDFAPSESIELAKSQRLTGGAELPTLEKSTLVYDLTGYDPNQYKAAIYDSEFFDFVTPRLMEFIENGGVGISAEVQDAIFNQTRERDLQTLNDQLVAAEANVARRGFPMPTGMSQAARSEVLGRYEDTRSARNREVTALIAERAQQNIMNAIQAGTTIEQAQMNFAAGFSKVFLDIGNQLLQKFRIEQEARVAEFEGQLKTILANLQIEQINAEVDRANNEQILKKWEIESSLAVEKTKALIAQAEEATASKLSAAQSLATFYSNLVAAALNQVNTIVSSAITEDVTP